MVALEFIISDNLATGLGSQWQHWQWRQGGVGVLMSRRSRWRGGRSGEWLEPAALSNSGCRAGRAWQRWCMAAMVGPVQHCPQGSHPHLHPPLGTALPESQLEVLRISTGNAVPERAFDRIASSNAEQSKTSDLAIF